MYTYSFIFVNFYHIAQLGTVKIVKYAELFKILSQNSEKLRL